MFEAKSCLSTPSVGEAEAATKVVLQRQMLKFQNIHRKTPVSECPF